MSHLSGSNRGRWFDRLFKRRDPRCLTTADFESVFELESTRSERSGHALSLVVFAIRVTGDEDQQLKPLVDLIVERKREYDAVGRLQGRRIGVLLPYTTSTGAWSFAEDIARRMAQHGVKVFTSVSSNESDDDHDSGLTAPLPRVPVKKSADEDAGEREKVVLAGNVHPSVDMFAFFERGPSIPKRTVDILGSSLALIVLSPLFLATAAAIKLTSPGPVFFRQKRAGQFGRPFQLYKFRSMYLDAEARKRDLMHLNEMDGPAFKMKNDPRVTPVGRWIRRLSIDEFPQFFNVLIGDMSLVGPRPPTLDELPGYERWHLRRLTRPGGLTCIWQTSGRNQVAFQEWMRMDRRYMRRASFGTDMRLIVKTVWTVATGHGAC